MHHLVLLLALCILLARYLHLWLRYIHCLQLISSTCALNCVQVAAGDGFTLALSTRGVVYGCGQFKDDIGSLSGGQRPDIAATPASTSRCCSLSRRYALLLCHPFVWWYVCQADVIVFLRRCLLHACAPAVHFVVLPGRNSLKSVNRTCVPVIIHVRAGFTAASKIEPLLVALLTPAGPKERVVKIAAGARHCVALTQGGTVLTWGIGSQGQLGRVPAFDQVWLLVRRLVFAVCWLASGPDDLPAVCVTLVAGELACVMVIGEGRQHSSTWQGMHASEHRSQRLGARSVSVCTGWQPVCWY